MYETRDRIKRRKLDKNLRNGKYSNDSFDRFGDDLCEVLLSYLSIKDEFCYECVCKQWKRLIFNKQRKLWIKLSEGLKVCEFGLNRIRVNEVFVEKSLKKLVNLSELEMVGINRKVIKIITNNCFNLQNIKIQSPNRSNIKLDLNKFGQKFGQTLRSLEVYDLNENSFQRLFSYTSNLRAVSYVENLNLFNKQYLQKLEQIYFEFSNLSDLKTLTDNYHKQIKDLCIGFFNIRLREDNVNNALIELSRFENIETLRLRIHTNDNNVIDTGLRLIVKKCTKLKHFCLSLFSVSLISGDLFQMISGMKSLVKLYVSFDNLIDRNFGKIMYLKNCKHLKNMRLLITDLSDYNLEGIHLYLPNLTHLTVRSLAFGRDIAITAKTLDNLAKMQNLSYLSTDSPDLNDSDVSHLIENSPKIRELILNDNSNINNQTINALIKRAKICPKVDYIFNYSTNENFDNCLKSLHDQIPSNLKFITK